MKKKKESPYVIAENIEQSIENANVLFYQIVNRTIGKEDAANALRSLDKIIQFSVLAMAYDEKHNPDNRIKMLEKDTSIEIVDKS